MQVKGLEYVTFSAYQSQSIELPLENHLLISRLRIMK
jgi:hypothetical protein